MTYSTIFIGGLAIAASSLSFPAPARADHSIPGADTPSQLAYLAFGEEGLTQAQTMTDEDMSIARGGYRGVYFTLFGYGDINQVGGTLPDGVEVTSQSADLVSMNLGLASLPNTGGFIQFASVVGNNNIVNNNLVLNVYFLEGGVADTSNIANGAFLGF